MGNYALSTAPLCPTCQRNTIHNRGSKRCQRCAQTPGWHLPRPDVTRAENGYIIETADALAVRAISETADALGDCNATMSMLYTVLEALGEVGSKHASHRVRVRVVKRGALD